MNTGFSWVRIDKGNIHCNFRYFNLDQVQTVMDYLLSYYEYRNVTVNIVDLGASGVLQEAGDHYRPPGADPAMNYYYLVQLHRHGTIIPQGCVEIMKTAINAIAMHQIIPESVFINKLQSNVLTVDDELTLSAITAKAGAPITWSSSDPAAISITSIAPDGMSCDIRAETPGTSNIEAAIQVAEEAPMELASMNYASEYWANNIYKYVGPTVTFDSSTAQGRQSRKMFGIEGFTQNNYYECRFDATAPNKYRWVETTYDGSPVMVTYKDIYMLVVRTYIRIIASYQRMHLYDYKTFEAYTPSTGLTIRWAVSSDALDFDSGISTGSSVSIEAKRVGTVVVTATVSDSYGTYEDSVPVTVFAIEVTPHEIKTVTGKTKSAVIAKDKIFSILPAVVVDWVTSNETIASVSSVTPSNPTTDFAQADIVANGVGQAYITAVAEDPADGTSYSDSILFRVGNVAINAPASTTINLLSSDTLTLTCDYTEGFVIDVADGWYSSNSGVVSITSVSGTNNSTVQLTGLVPGSSLITVTAKNGAATDTDQILITVVDASVVTSGEMATFTHGMYNGHGVIDWNHPTGEEGAFETDRTDLDLATEAEVDGFVGDLFEEEESAESTEASEDSGDDPDSSEDFGDGED